MPKLLYWWYLELDLQEVISIQRGYEGGDFMLDKKKENRGQGDGSVHKVLTMQSEPEFSLQHLYEKLGMAEGIGQGLKTGSLGLADQVVQPISELQVQLETLSQKIEGEVNGEEN